MSNTTDDAQRRDSGVDLWPLVGPQTPGLEAKDGYYYLQDGDLVRDGDEYDACADAWKDWPDWKPVLQTMIGGRAPDPQYIAHTKFRRQIRPNVADEQRRGKDSNHE